MMMTTTRAKISARKFQQNSRQVISFADRKNMEVIIYNEEGLPIARLSPLRNKSRANAPKTDRYGRISVSQMSQGGVWSLGTDTRRMISKQARRPRHSFFSFSSLWKTARVSAIIPFLTRM